MIIHLLPIWLFNYFPSQDGPSHLHNASVLKNFNKPEYSTLREYYQLNITLAPNLISHYFLAGFMYIFSPLIAEKINDIKDYLIP